MLPHQVQQILYDHVPHVPIYELAFTWGIGPRLEEPGISLIKLSWKILPATK